MPSDNQNSFVINTQSVAFIAVQQAIACGLELSTELKELARDFDIYNQQSHPNYTKLLNLINEEVA